ncbi:hypothetical protein GCM10027589_05880 [Actinocorallia lasiicapitis]
MSQFAEKNYQHNGGNHAELFLLYSDATNASDAFSELREKVNKCKKKIIVKRTPLPDSDNKRFDAGFDSEWSDNDKPVAKWTRIGGFQKADFADYFGKYNVVYTAFDYALRGNLVVVSLYWEGTEPAKSGAPIAKRAEALLVKQLERLG